jgi:hypothetical protein
MKRLLGESERTQRNFLRHVVKSERCKRLDPRKRNLFQKGKKLLKITLKPSGH